MGEGVVNNKIEIKTYLDKKDLELYNKALFETNTKLLVEVQSLREKVHHLEELLKNIDSIPTIGANK